MDFCFMWLQNKCLHFYFTLIETKVKMFYELLMPNFSFILLFFSGLNKKQIFCSWHAQCINPEKKVNYLWDTWIKCYFIVITISSKLCPAPKWKFKWEKGQLKDSWTSLLVSCAGVSFLENRRVVPIANTSLCRREERRFWR